jgi:hypothetical protein
MRGHLPALDHGVMDPAPALYLIRIRGHLGTTMLSAFPALAPQQDGAHTVLTGLLDASALHGVLAEIEALGLDLIEVRQLEPHRNHKNQVTAAHRDGASSGRTRSPLSEGEALLTRCPVRDPLARSSHRPAKRGTPAHRLPALAAGCRTGRQITRLLGTSCSTHSSGVFA